MPKPRRSGGSVSMRVSSSLIVPPDSGSSPAMQLSAVDFPQPEGPSSAMNSPRRIVSVMSLSALNTWPPLAAKRRVTRSRRSSLKSCFMLLSVPSHAARFPGARRGRNKAREPRGLIPLPLPAPRGEGLGEPRRALLGFLGSDLLIPDAECVDLRLRFQRLRVREFLEPLVVFRPPVFLDGVLTFLRRHRQRHVLHGGTGIEIALVVRVGLGLRRQQKRHQVEDDRNLLRCHALRHHHVVRVVDPRHALEDRKSVV